MSEEGKIPDVQFIPASEEAFYHRVREGILISALLCIAGVLIHFFAPVLAGKNDTLFLRANALSRISLWLFILGAVLLILCFAFWLADGMLANRNKNNH